MEKADTHMISETAAKQAEELMALRRENEALSEQLKGLVKVEGRL